MGEGVGEGDGDGEGKALRSRSEGSKRRRSSRFGNRKDVSEWARLWWDPRFGVSGIWSITMSVAVAGAGGNFDSIISFILCSGSGAGGDGVPCLV